MILASANLCNRLDPDKQRKQLERIAARGADVIVVQEAVAHYTRGKGLRGWTGKQFDRWLEHPSGEAVLWKASLTVRRTGGRLANQASPGGLSRRFYPWADVVVPGVGVVRAICAHRAPRRNNFPALIWPLADWRLRRVCRRATARGLHWAVGADWNQRLSTDPAKLRARLGGVPFGHRIDGWVVSPSLARYVVHMEVVPDGRADDHDEVYITVALPKEKS